MSGRGLLTLSRRNGGRERIVPHAAPSLSWVPSDAGQFSCLIPANVARAFDFVGGDSAGVFWLRYQYPGLPDWGGVVTQPTWSDGQFELGAESFEVLLRKRRVPRLYQQQSATPGALAHRAFTDVQADDPTGIVSFEADEYGDPVAWEWRGGDLHDDVFRQLVSASGQEWTVDADRNLQWRAQLGTDKTGTVMLYGGVHIVGHRYTTDLWTVVNDLEGVAADARYERSVSAIRSHNRSIRTFGRRYQASRRYERVVKGGTLVRKVWTDLRANAWPAEVMELTTINISGSWELYHIGDSVSICLPDADVVRRCRILARAVDVEQGLETLGVEVLHEADGW